MHIRPPAGGSAARQHLFAYGSLVEPRCLDEVLGHAHPGERLRARLPGYERLTATTYPFPFVVEADGRAVDGILVMELSPYDIDVLDRYEEVDIGVYRREVVEVEAWGCGPRALRLHAHVYVAGPALLASTAS
jgi:gamma-glutamylcyclotransferase (GGCT)/AIG2-like uncharacterized protein YtfP